MNVIPVRGRGSYQSPGGPIGRDLFPKGPGEWGANARSFRHIILISLAGRVETHPCQSRTRRNAPAARSGTAGTRSAIRMAAG